MKIRPIQAKLLLLILSGSIVTAAPFQNLGFDDAVTNTSSLHLEQQPFFPPFISGTGPAADLLPGWKLTLNQTPITTLGYNVLDSVATNITLVDPIVGREFATHVDGKYGLYFRARLDSGSSISLSQTGEVPEGARFLSMGTNSFGFLPSVNGVPLERVREEGIFDLFHISPFAGQTVELTLKAISTGLPPSGYTSFADNLVFVIPEPSTWSLLIMGLGFGIWHLRKKIL